MTIYADTSFFVSLYLPDQHTAEAQQRVSREGTLWFTDLHRAEWAHAVAQHVFQGRIAAREAQKVYRNLDGDRKVRLWLEIGLPETAFETCVKLARRYGARLGVRALDSLHVASALELGADTFWTFDQRQAALAKAAGLKLG